MATYRLKDTHDFAIRFEQLMHRANELKISLNFNYSQLPTYITDDLTGEGYKLIDTDSSAPVKYFPPQEEYKIVFEKD